MNPAAIFLPMLSMMALTATVWFYMYAKRIPAMRRARLSVQTYTTPEAIAEHLDPATNYPAYNLKNLFELPVLFYGLCLYLYVTSNVDSTYLIAAWLFVALRVVHSIVHCTMNIVMVRFYFYAASSMVLWFMVGRALLAELVDYV